MRVLIIITLYLLFSKYINRTSDKMIINFYNFSMEFWFFKIFDSVTTWPSFKNSHWAPVYFRCKWTFIFKSTLFSALICVILIYLNNIIKFVFFFFIEYIDHRIVFQAFVWNLHTIVLDWFRAWMVFQASFDHCVLKDLFQGTWGSRLEQIFHFRVKVFEFKSRCFCQWIFAPDFQ